MHMYTYMLYCIHKYNHEIKNFIIQESKIYWPVLKSLYTYIMMCT